MSTLDEQITLRRDELQLCPEGHPDRPSALYNLAFALYDRFSERGAITDLNEALALNRETLALRPEGDPDRTVSLSEVANCLHVRFNQLGKFSDLEEAIALQRNALELHPQGDPDRALSLANMAGFLHTRFTESGMLSDLDEALALQRDALELFHEDDPHRNLSLGNLAWYHHVRFSHLGSLSDLDEAIALGRHTLEFRPHGHPYRSVSFANLAVSLRSRFKQRGALSDLDEAISLQRNALELCHQENPNYATFLGSIAESLLVRFEELGTKPDLDEALALHRSTLELHPHGHPRRAYSLRDVASCLYERFIQFGILSDLDEALALQRNALELLPQGHPARPNLLSNMANSLHCRFSQLRIVSDLDDALTLERSALELRSSGDPIRPFSLCNIARYLYTRFIELGMLSDLDEALALGRNGLELVPEGHIHRAVFLGNTAAYLYSRFGRLGEVSNLDEALVLARSALDLRPQGHPLRAVTLANVACYVYARFKKHETLSDLDDAIALERDALQLRPKGSPDRAFSLGHLASRLHVRFKQSGDIRDLQETFGLYSQLADIPHTLSYEVLIWVKYWIGVAEESGHSSTILAYQTFLRLSAHHFAALPPLPQHLVLLKQLLTSSPVDAFSACVRHGNLENAVEFLEQGRGVFWSQLLRLRSPLDDVIASGSRGKELADKFTQLASQLRGVLNTPQSDFQSQHEQAFHLQIQLQDVITDIRKMPGLSRLFQPPLYSELQTAAAGGPVIVVNASKYGCDALIVLSGREPIHVPLSITKVGVCGLLSNLRFLLSHAKFGGDVSRDLGVLLRELWDMVVFPIVNVLEKYCPRRSRIWWCPTAEFSLLPLHAAGTYRKGHPNLASLYISSYTPTLTALIRTRSKPSQLTSTSRFLVVGQAQAHGHGQLLSVNDELSSIAKRVGPIAVLTSVQGQDASTISFAQQVMSNHFVHLACHGTPDQKHPFASGFALGDGLLQIEHIMRYDLQHAQFAYLSACHTTVGDEESPDEVIHLAAAMQFAGFRSVIGTMWAVDDAHTHEITSRFYECMVGESGELDHTRAAWALHRTMKSVSKMVPLDQRILYIHIGA